MIPYTWHFPWIMLQNTLIPPVYEADGAKGAPTTTEAVKRRQRVWSKRNSETLYRLCNEKSRNTQTSLDDLNIEDMMEISEELDRTPQQCLSKLRLILSCGSLKAGVWSCLEDNRLVSKINEGKRWYQIARSLNKEIHRSVKVRTGKQCKERWKNHLNPVLNHGPWNTQQDIKLLKSVQNHGLQWRKLKQEMPERTENSIKNRMKSFLNKKWQEIDTIEAEASFDHIVNNLISSLVKNIKDNHLDD